MNLRKTQKFRSALLGKILAVVVGLFVCAGAFAQSKTVTGTVTEPNGDPAIGATVLVKGTSVAVPTNVDGKYSINVPASGKVLEIKYLGMKTKEVEITGNSIDVVLESDASMLDEVVVIGYGTVRKKDLTGSVSSIGDKVIKDIPVSSAAQAITGRLAGVQVTSTDGSPDAEVLIRVRGGGSVTGDNSPLYIIDGFPAKSINDVSPTDIQSIDILKDASSTAIYGSQGANGVVIITTKSAKGGKTQVSYNGFLQTKTLSKRMDVLDAYQYALFNYERAALDGTSAQESFLNNFGYWSDMDLYKYQKVYDAQDDLFGSDVLSQQHNISIQGGNDKTKFNLSGTYNKDGGLMVNNDYSRFTLNFKLNHEIAKNLHFDFLARTSDTETNGSGTSGGTYKMRTSEAVSRSKVKGLSEFTIADPSRMTEDEYEQWLKSQMTLSEEAQQYWKRKNARAFNFQGALTWDIFKGLTYKLEGGYEYAFNEQKNYWGPTTTQSSNEGQNLPLVDWTKTNGGSMRVANTLTYRYTLNEKHRFDILAGQELKNITNDNNYIKAKYFAKSMTPEKIFANLGLSEGVNNLSTTSFVSPEDKMSSFFGRLNYGYDDRYLLTFTFRADGSSKFAKGNRWGYFPAAAAAWRINEEAFMQSTKRWLSNLKLRLSYGEAGNNRIANTLYKMDYKITGSSGSSRSIGVGEVLNPFYAPTNAALANPGLKWETTVTRNAGLDFGIFNERLSGTLDFYQNTTKDLLLESDIVAPGFTKQYRNVGQTTNKGVELTLDAYLIDKKDFTLSANFNIGLNRGNVDKLENGILSQSYNSGWAGTDLKGQDDYRVIVGEPLGLMYGYVTDGYYTANDFVGYNKKENKWTLKEGVANTGYVTVRPGALKLKDLNKDGVVDENDRKIIGHAAPKSTGGFGLRGTYKGFDASVYFNWVYGNEVYNADKIAGTQQYRSTYPNVLAYMNSSNRYTYLNDNGEVIYRAMVAGDIATADEFAAIQGKLNEMNKLAQYWSPHNFGNAVVIPHSWAIEDASFLRLQNITVGYTVPKKYTSKFACSQLRVFTTFNNVAVWTNYTGYDPEVSTAVRGSSTSGLTPGVDYSSFPKSFSCTFGLNLTF